MSDTTLSLSPRGLICHSPRMRELLRDVERAAAMPGGVLLSGEPGSGRGAVARAIHAGERDGAHLDSAPFIALYCNKADHSQLELELFGPLGTPHRVSGPPSSPFAPPRPPRERVAPGSLLHRARGGTLYFAHVEMLPDRVQARLVRLLDDREAFIGAGHEPEPFIVRPMTALDKRGPSDREEDRIRPDLFARLSAITIQVPPLRDRREDIPELAASLVGRACRQRGLPAKRLATETLAVLSALPWKGNARELNELLDTLVLKAEGGDVTLDALMAHVRLENPGAEALGAKARTIGTTLRQARQQFEREYISAVLAHHRGRIPDAARALGIQRTNLYRKLRTLQLVKTRVSVAPDL